MAQKRLGDLLIEAGLITGEQLQSAITHQKIAKGRLGSNLVAMGFITEETLMEFLGQQMNVDRVDVRNVDLSPDLLNRIPKRMAEQYLILPVAFKEPKTLVLAMADPMDLNAVDSARFATGMHIETVVAAHSAMKAAISEQYRKLQTSEPTTITVGAHEEGLPVNFTFQPLDVTTTTQPTKLPTKAPAPFKRDPFFDEVQLQPGQVPNNGVTMPLDNLPDLDLTILSAPAPAPGTQTGAGILPERTLGVSTQRLDSFKDRELLFGLIRLLQRRGIFTSEDLQRTVVAMIEAGEITVPRIRGGDQTF